MKQRQADKQSFFYTTTNIKSFFQTDLKSAEIVSFLKNRHKVRKNETMYADLLSDKITDIVTADTKSGTRKKATVLNYLIQ
jgi:hypothetical protein